MLPNGEALGRREIDIEPSRPAQDVAARCAVSPGRVDLEGLGGKPFSDLCPREPSVRNGVEITSARSLPVKLAELSTPEVTESGKPDCQFQIPLVCQPPKICRSAPEAGDGSCQT